jgi:hypothetical protein
MLTNKQYDSIKQIALIAAPLAVLLSTILKVWHVPYTAEITATLAAINVFLGSFVSIQKAMYDKKNEED